MRGGRRGFGGQKLLQRDRDGWLGMGWVLVGDGVEDLSTNKREFDRSGIQPRLYM